MKLHSEDPFIIACLRSTLLTLSGNSFYAFPSKSELSNLAQPSLTAAEESTGGKQERRRHKPNLSGLLTAAGASAAGTNAAVQELRNMRAVFGLWLVGRQACDCDF